MSQALTQETRHLVCRLKTLLGRLGMELGDEPRQPDGNIRIDLLQRLRRVVPDFAESYYYVRHPDPAVVAEVFERVRKAAEGAALGTGTTVDHEVINGVYSMLPNDALMSPVVRHRLPEPAPHVHTLSWPHSHRL